MRAISAPDQRGAVLEILRAVLRPDFKLPVVSGQSLDMQPSLAGRCGLAQCRSGERAVKLILRRFEVRRTRPEQSVAPSPTLRGRPHSRRRRSAPAACGSSTCPPPPPDPGYLEKRRSIPSSVKLLIVKATEIRRQAAERPDERELRGDDVIGETEPDLLRKLETTLGFALHFDRADRPPREGACSGGCS